MISNAGICDNQESQLGAVVSPKSWDTEGKKNFKPNLNANWNRLFFSFWDDYVFRCFVCSLIYFILANICFYLYGSWVQNGFSVTT